MHYFIKTISAILLAGLSFTSNAQSSEEPAIKNTIATVKPEGNLAATEAPLNTSNPVSSVILPARTSIRMTLTNAVGSKKSLPGEQFALTVSEDIKIGDHAVIPMGAPAVGEVIHAQKAKGFGKAGELLITVRYIDLNGTKIKMRSFQPLQGNDKTTTAMAVSQIPVAGLFSGFIQGGDIEIPALTQVQAQTSAETVLPVHTNKQITPPTNTTNGDSK